VVSYGDGHAVKYGEGRPEIAKSAICKASAEETSGILADAYRVRQRFEIADNGRG